MKRYSQTDSEATITLIQTRHTIEKKKKKKENYETNILMNIDAKNVHSNSMKRNPTIH